MSLSAAAYVARARAARSPAQIARADAYVARLRAAKAARTPEQVAADDAHHARLLAESAAVGARMAADPRYCAETPEARDAAWASYRRLMGETADTRPTCPGCGGRGFARLDERFGPAGLRCVECKRVFRPKHPQQGAEQ